MKSSKMGRRIHIIKTFLRNPKYVIQGSLAYIYDNGHFGKLPTKYAFSTIEAGDLEICLQRLTTISGGTTLAELGTLAYITKHQAPKKICEFGTVEGRTTLNFAINSPDDCRIDTLDLPVETRKAYYVKRLGEIKVWQRDEQPPFLDDVGTCFKDHPSSHKIHQLFGDSTTFDFSSYYGSMDLIFIDANHDYEYVKSDTENAMKMISERGIIIWHDYPNIRGVMDYLDELYLSGLPLYHLWGTHIAIYYRADNNQFTP
jgi:predicted O-methyltransferase YrrM